MIKINQNVMVKDLKGKIKMSNENELMKKFKIKESERKVKPQYIIHITMDANDADYVEKEVKFNENEWNKLPLIFFYCLMFCSKGVHSGALEGKFSTKEWNDSNYGHRIVDNSDFSFDITDVMFDFDLLCKGWNDDYCHSYEDIEITYIDENKKKHEVEIPDIDDEFNTKEEMISSLNKMHDEYINGLKIIF